MEEALPDALSARSRGDSTGRWSAKRKNEQIPPGVNMSWASVSRFQVMYGVRCRMIKAEIYITVRYPARYKCDAQHWRPQVEKIG